MKNILIIKFLLFTIFMVNAQDKNFKLRYQDFINGDITLIANGILNRVEGKTSANEPHNDVRSTAKHNDQYKMHYIDIDDDNSTFSSSSATLALKNVSSNIKFAGLYWAGTYKCNVMDRNLTNKYIMKDSVRHSFNKVKIKFPGALQYEEIEGKILYDGFNSSEFNSNSPYTAFANVTDKLKSLSKINGEYTVANIRATQGYLEGGNAAGWTLVVVYENEAESKKQITLYDGFLPVYEKPTTFTIDNFVPPTQGNVRAKIAGSSLEGDLNIKGDEVAIKSNHSSLFSTLEYKSKSANNFFNSTIAIDDKVFMERNPNSINTLGFDAFVLPINNDNNKIINNQTTSIDIKLRSYTDRYYLFMLGFSVEAQNAAINFVATKDNSNVIVAESQPKEIVTKISETKNIAKEIPTKVIVAENTAKQESVKTENHTIKTTNNDKPKEVLLPTTSNNDAAKQTTSETKTIIKETAPKEVVAENIIKQESVKTEKPTIKTANNDKPKEVLLPTTSNNDVAKQTTSETKTIIKETAPKEAVAETTAKQITENNSVEKDLTIPQITSENISNVKKGYYLVANVFRSQKNAANFLQSLKNRGIPANSFYNSSKQFYYVYIYYTLDRDDAVLKFNNNFNHTYNQELWIKAVNL